MQIEKDAPIQSSFFRVQFYYTYTYTEYLFWNLLSKPSIPLFSGSYGSCFARG